MNPESKENWLTTWNTEWEHRRVISKFGELFPIIDESHSGIFMAFQNKCSRSMERFFLKLRSNTWTKTYSEIPCKCGYDTESAWHILCECTLIDSSELFVLQDLDFTQEKELRARRILDIYEAR